MKKIGWLLLIMALGVWGCVTADNSTLIDTGQQGYASGQYRDTHQGKVADFGIFGTGAGVGARGRECCGRHAGLKDLSGADPGRPAALCQVHCDD